MIEINNTRAGFFSSLFYVLNQCHLAELNDDDININVFSLCYLDSDLKLKTSFHQYFNDPYLNIEKNFKYPISYNDIKDIENIISYNQDIICGFILDIEMRKYINFLINKYLKINTEIQIKITEQEKNFNNKKTLGIHIRQTDHFIHGKLLDINTYVDTIKKEIDNFDLLYVMSDNYEVLNILINSFNNKIYYINDVIRANNKTSFCVHSDNNIKNRYKLGEDILIETMLLSKCDTVLLSNSNISNFVLCVNPEIKYHIMDLNLKNF